jgi:hypothetical protein
VLEREFQLDSLLHECILSYELRKIRLAPYVPERKYCVSRRVCTRNSSVREAKEIIDDKRSVASRKCDSYAT